MLLVVQPAVEDVPALPAVKYLRASLQVELAVVRFIGRLRLEDDVAQFTEVRIIHLVFVVHVLPEQNVIFKRFTTIVAFLHCIFL